MFETDVVSKYFLERLGDILYDICTLCYAWALISLKGWFQNFKTASSEVWDPSRFFHSFPQFENCWSRPLCF